MDHLSPHTSCRWPCSRRSDCTGGARLSLCRIMRSRLPEDSCSAFQASAPEGRAEGGVRLTPGPWGPEGAGDHARPLGPWAPHRRAPCGLPA